MTPHRISTELSGSAVDEIQSEQDDQDRRFLDAEWEYESVADGDA